MSTSYPIDHPLYSARAKVKRANTHIQALRHSISRALDPKVAFTVEKEFQGDHPLSGAKLARLDMMPNVRATWGLMVGDVVTNLRSSLDHIAWALAERHASDIGKTWTDREKRSISFPLGDDPAKFSMSKCILPTAESTIASFQPYNRSQWPELILMAILDDLSRRDKHRLVVSARRQLDVRLGSDKPIVFLGLDQPTSQQFIIPPGVGPNLEPHFTFDEVVHSVAGLRGFSLTQLHLIHDFIRGEVIPAFAGFFK